MKKILLCSEKIPENTATVFHSLQYDVMYIPECETISAQVSSHPDMLFSVMGDRHLLTDYNYFMSNKTFFNSLGEKGVKISLSEKKLSETYPSDILFDAIKTEKLLIGNLKFTSPELFSEGIKAVNVKQGYALCSTLLMEGAAISADRGICKALSENGYEVLQISEGGIVLDGYSCGFIGGASAVLNDRKVVVFFGNIYGHRDGEKIVKFCEKQGYTVYFDKSAPLTDFGGVKVV